jgi:hypothetical protein
MKLIEDKGLRLLLPESDNLILYSIKSNDYYEKVYLGKFDVIDNYREIDKSLLKNNSKDVDDLLDIINKQDAALTELSNKLNELSKLIPSNDDKAQ